MKKFQKKGIGKKIVEQTLKIAKKKSEKKVYAIVDTHNILSQKILESVGFKKLGIISYFRFLNFKRLKEDNLIIKSKKRKELKMLILEKK